MFIDALKENGLTKVLAEPTLITQSGRSASFLAGGEFPIPVPQSSGGVGTTITIEYKTFGVGLNFTPTVLGNGKINMMVNPEVSELDFTRGRFAAGIHHPEPHHAARLDGHRAGRRPELCRCGALRTTCAKSSLKFPVLGDTPDPGGSLPQHLVPEERDGAHHHRDAPPGEADRHGEADPADRRPTSSPTTSSSTSWGASKAGEESPREIVARRLRAGAEEGKRPRGRFGIHEALTELKENLMRKTIAIIVSLSFTAGLLISCAAPTRLEMDYGTSYKLQKYNQIANPDAEKNLKPVEGLESQAAAGAMNKYHKEFEKQEKAPSGISNLSNTGK